MAQIQTFNLIIRTVLVLLLISGLNTAVNADLCEPTDIYSDGICWRMFIEEKPYEDAKLDCQVIGGYLAEIRTDSNRDIITSMARAYGTQVWIGLIDHRTEGLWEWESDLSPAQIPQSYWAEGEPNNYRNNEHCVMLRQSGLLNDANCNKNSSYICELTGLSVRRCEQSDVVIDHKCVKFFNGSRTHQEAQDYCEAGRGRLLEIRSEELRDWAESKVKEVKKSVWIGATDETSEGEWVWSSDSAPVDIPKSWWANGEPNNYQGKEHCMWMKKGGKLADTKCEKTSFFSCEYLALRQAQRPTDVTESTVGQGSVVTESTVGQGAVVTESTVGQGSGVTENTVGQGSEVTESTVGQGSGVTESTVGQGSGVTESTVGQGSGVTESTVGQGSVVTGSTVGQGSGVTESTVGQGSGVTESTVGQGSEVTESNTKQGTTVTESGGGFRLFRPADLWRGLFYFWSSLGRPLNFATHLHSVVSNS